MNAGWSYAKIYDILFTLPAKGEECVFSLGRKLECICYNAISGCYNGSASVGRW